MLPAPGVLGVTVTVTGAAVQVVTPAPTPGASPNSPSTYGQTSVTMLPPCATVSDWDANIAAERAAFCVEIRAYAKIPKLNAATNEKASQGTSSVPSTTAWPDRRFRTGAIVAYPQEPYRQESRISSIPRFSL